MFSKLTRLTSYVKSAFIDLKASPFEGICALLIVLVTALAVVMFAISFIQFAVGGGYAYQVRHLQEVGFFNGLFSAFTVGRTSTYFNARTIPLFFGLLAVSLMSIKLAYITKETGGKRTGMIFLSSLIFLVGILLPLLFTLLYIGIMPIPLSFLRATWPQYSDDILREALMRAPQGQLFNMVLNEHFPVAKISFGVWFGVLAVAVVVLFIIFKNSHLRELMSQWRRTFVITVAVAPLGLLLLKNVIPLAILMVIIVVVWLVILLFSSGNKTEVTAKKVESVDRKTGERRTGTMTSESGKNKIEIEWD